MVLGQIARADDLPPVSGITIERAVELAATRNERAAIADLNVVVADAAVIKARAAFLPIVNGRADGNLRPWDKTVTSADATLTVNQPIFVPTAFPLYDQAKHSLVGQREQTIDDKRVLGFDTAHAYLAVLLANEVLEAAQKKLATAQHDFKDATAQFNAQIASNNDVSRTQIELNDAQREIEQDKGALEAAYVQLEFLCNAHVTREIAQPTALLGAAAVSPGSGADLVKSAIVHRPDLAARRDVALAAHDFAREPHLRFVPTLAASGAINAATTGEPDNHDVDAVLGLTLNWSIFDGRARDADEQSRGAQAAVADLTADALARSIEAQILSSLAQLVAAQGELTAARDTATAAEHSATETALLYRENLAKAIELVDANEQRFEADVSLAQAQDTAANAYLALRQALGLDAIGTELK
nr:TolC family protein [Kofleriaceae bacterium]